MRDAASGFTAGGQRRSAPADGDNLAAASLEPTPPSRRPDALEGEGTGAAADR